MAERTIHDELDRLVGPKPNGGAASSVITRAEARLADPNGDRFLRLNELARLAELAGSYWQSIALAADRGEIQIAVLHCKQVAAVTREAFALSRALGAEEARAGAAPEAAFPIRPEETEP
jgi:hypothetical protein